MEQRIETAVRYIAAACVFVYVCGLVFGEWLHRLNDDLANWYSGLIVKTPTEIAPAEIGANAPIPAPTPTLVLAQRAVTSPARGIGTKGGLTVKELRQKARKAGIKSIGGRPISKARKAELMEVLA